LVQFLQESNYPRAPLIINMLQDQNLIGNRKKFVSFSHENLNAFCESQVRNRMGPIIGDISNPYAKFVKELYFQTESLQNEFNAFALSDASVFGITGLPTGNDDYN
jgi:hypothetical protein